MQWCRGRRCKQKNAAAADAEWNPQENGKPSSTEYIGMRSLHQREGPEKKEKMENSNSAIKKREHGWKKSLKANEETENVEKNSTSVTEVKPEVRR